MRRAPAIALSAALSLIACGKEVGRIPFKEPGPGNARVALHSGDVAFWTSLDVKYTGTLVAGYEVALDNGQGVEVGPAKCDPLSVHTKIKSLETNLGDEHSLSYQGKMGCSLSVPADGTYTVRAGLAILQRPAQLEIRDMSLVIKQ